MISGIGIHSGETCRVRLHRASGPLIFRRGAATIPAAVGAVVATDRCVVLAEGTTRVAMVEHLLAALRTAGFWSGVVVEVDGGELPILDGSARPWVEEIALLGPPPPEPHPLEPTRPLRVSIGDAVAETLPGPGDIDVNIDYAHPAIGRQRWCGGPDSWQELLDARTFGFMAEVETLRAAGLASAASTENAIVFDDDGPLDGPLRHADEPVRHKALDLLGDLTLLGRPVAADIRVSRGSHRLHVNLMRQLLHYHSPQDTLA